MLRHLSLPSYKSIVSYLRRGSFTEALASELINALPLECGRTSAEPSGDKLLVLRKWHCLSRASLTFLTKSFLERGNLTAVKLEAVERAFSFFFSAEKGQTR